MTTPSTSPDPSDGGRHERMPVIFVGHGNPMNAIAKNRFAKGWRTIGGSIPKPDAILCISAHWETYGTRITAAEHPATIHDFFGFPEELSAVTYPAPGYPTLAAEIARSVKAVHVRPDTERGLDHGCWSVLIHMFPKANIPVVEMSMDRQKGIDWHFNLAKELSPLRSNRILIIGSGNIVHNLAAAKWHDPAPYAWAVEANEQLKQLIDKNDIRALFDYSQLGEAVRLAVPTPEHFLPLLYILGLREEQEPISFFNDGIDMGSISMTSVLFGGG